MSNTTIYRKGQKVTYHCPACGQQTTFTIEGVQWFPGAGLVLATCDACGSTRTIDRLPGQQTTQAESSKETRTWKP